MYGYSYGLAVLAAVHACTAVGVEPIILHNEIMHVHDCILNRVKIQK